MKKFVPILLLASTFFAGPIFAANSFPVDDSIIVNNNTHKNITITTNPAGTTPWGGSIFAKPVEPTQWIVSSELDESNADEFFQITNIWGRSCIVDVQSALYSSKHYLLLYSKTPGIQCLFKQTSDDGVNQKWVLDVTSQ